MLLFIARIFNYSGATWDSLRDHLRDIPREYTFNLGASSAAAFCDWVQGEIDLYIPHRIYQLQPRLFPRFSTASAAAGVP